jgi:hypothetical protein
MMASVLTPLWRKAGGVKRGTPADETIRSAVIARADIAALAITDLLGTGCIAV